MPFEIVRNDITNIQADAVVSTANSKPVSDSGIGNAVITPASDSSARYVINTTIPIWEDGNRGDEKILSSCYRKSLDLAKEYGCDSIAFPLIASDNDGFPKPLALQIAVREISTFLIENEMQIYLVVSDKEDFGLSEKLYESVSSYIDENYICDKTIDEYASLPEAGYIRQTNQIYEGAFQEEASYKCLDMSVGAAAPMDSEDWGELLDNLDAGFSETLLELIDRTGKKDSEIYKKANVDRKLFSKIRNNMNYKPSKTTALAFAFALELDIDETKDFIGRAGFALSHSSKFDVIVEYFLVNRNYDIFELNEVLFAFDQPLIGA